MVGTTVSHHRIFSKLGQGGTGIAYDPEGLNLTCTAALSFLSQRLHPHETKRARFLQDTQ